MGLTFTSTGARYRKVGPVIPMNGTLTMSPTKPLDGTTDYPPRPREYVPRRRRLDPPREPRKVNRLLNEPVLIGGAIRAVILAGAAFGLQVSEDQLAALMLAVEAVLMLVTRTMVTPNQLAEARVDRAQQAGQPVTPMTATTPRT